MLRTLGRSPSARTLIFPLLATLLAIILTFPVWQWLWREWQGNQYYSHGLLIPIVVLYLIVQRVRLDTSLRGAMAKGNSLGLLVLLISVTTFVWTISTKAYYLSAFTLIGIVAGIVWIYGGWHTLRRLLFPVSYLALMVPLPFLDRITLPLALFTGVCSGGLVQFLGLDVKIVGNAVTLPNANLIIGAQCSGINSLITLTSLTALTAYVFNGPWWGRVLLILMAIPLAIVTNILRVSSLLYVARWFGANAAFVFYHDYSGFVFFLLSLILLYPLTRLLRCTQLRLNVI